jgi:hypothetical protein
MAPGLPYRGPYRGQSPLQGTVTATENRCRGQSHCCCRLRRRLLQMQIRRSARPAAPSRGRYRHRYRGRENERSSTFDLFSPILNVVLAQVSPLYDPARPVASLIRTPVCPQLAVDFPGNIGDAESRFLSHGIDNASPRGESFKAEKDSDHAGREDQETQP